MALTPRQRKVAAAAVAATLIAAPAEGLRQLAYYDPPGILTACRGHTGPDVQKNVVYSLAQCDQWMTADMTKAVTAVDKCAPDAPEGVLIAFGDAVFNLGPTIACDPKNSTAARLLSQKRYLEACGQLLRWDKAKVAGVMVSLPGLTKRRNEEYRVCVRGLA